MGRQAFPLEMTGRPVSLNDFNITMFYVYYLRSQLFPERTYIGFTNNLRQRLLDHNAGKSIYTKQYRPWSLVGFLGFDEEIKAIRFEKYLKSNAGRIFLRRYFNSNEEIQK